VSSRLYKIRSWQRRLDTLKRNAEALNSDVIEEFGLEGKSAPRGDVVSDYSDDVVLCIDSLAHVLEIAATEANQKKPQPKAQPHDQ